MQVDQTKGVAVIGGHTVSLAAIEAVIGDMLSGRAGLVVFSEDTAEKVHVVVRGAHPDDRPRMEKRQVATSNAIQVMRQAFETFGRSR